MAFFLVTMTHPDGDGWGRHVVPHVNYLKGLIEAGEILASGPVTGLGKRAGFIIMTVADREDGLEEVRAAAVETGLLDQPRLGGAHAEVP